MFSKAFCTNITVTPLQGSQHQFKIVFDHWLQLVGVLISILLIVITVPKQQITTSVYDVIKQQIQAKFLFFLHLYQACRPFVGTLWVWPAIHQLDVDS